MGSVVAETHKGRHYIGSDLVADAIDTEKVPNTKIVTALALSPEGKYLAIGDATGRVTLRCMHLSGRRFPFIFNAGEGVGVTVLLWLRGVDPWTLFIASGNGRLNCIIFDKDDSECTPRITGIKAPSHISCLAVNDDETQLAVSYDYTTKVYPLPFEEGDPVKLGKSAGRLINQDYPGFKWHLTPVADHPRALSLHYLDNNTLCVAFFRKIEAYDTNPESKMREKLWTIPAPDGTYIGSCAISPSKKLIVTTNLHSGWDWFSIQTRSWMSKTAVEDTYSTKNQLLPIAFLSENTVASGHNLGQLITGSNGVVATKALGRRRGDPSQYLTVSISDTRILIVYASGTSVTANTITLATSLNRSTSQATNKPTLSAKPHAPPSPTIPSSLTVNPKHEGPLVSILAQDQRATPSGGTSQPLKGNRAIRSRPSVTFGFDTSPIDDSDSYFQTPAETPAAGPRPLVDVLARNSHLPWADLSGPPPRDRDRTLEPKSLIDLDDRDLASGMPDWERTLRTQTEEAKWDIHRALNMHPRCETDINIPGWGSSPAIGPSNGVHDGSRPSRSISPPSPLRTLPLIDPSEMTVSIEDPSSPLARKGVQHRPQPDNLLRGSQDRPTEFTGLPASIIPPPIQPVRPVAQRERRHRPNHGPLPTAGDQPRAPPKGRGDNESDDDSDGEDDDIGVWEALLTLLAEGLGGARANPKIVLLTLAFVVALVSVARPDSLLNRNGINTTSRPPSRPQENLHLSAEDGGHPVDDGDLNGDFEEGYGDDGCEPVVLTETKVLTVTRTVTHTTTVTTTVTSQASSKPKRAQKAWRKDRRR